MCGSIRAALLYPWSNSNLFSPGTEGGTEKLVLLNDIADVEAFISGAEVAVVGFFQVRWQQLSSDMSDIFHLRWEPYLWWDSRVDGALHILPRSASCHGEMLEL